MKISEKWLRDWVDPDVDTAALAEQLTMAGLEVDGVELCAPPLKHVVVGRVLEKRAHPNADKLSLCTVDVGADESLQIVCGAPNVAEGGVYPVAMIGAVLPGDFKIKRSKIRGEESFGMMCSTVELGMGDGGDGLLELNDSYEAGMSITDALALDDYVIDLDLTPNRADCFSILGVARDVAAVNRLEFDEPAFESAEAELKDRLEIKLAAEDACPAFAGRVIKNIDSQATTPIWMAEKLRRCGVRLLHPVVDVTNFVMLELGQPMHAYDLAKLSGGIVARFAAPGEKITLLDEQQIDLADDVMVIADDSGPVALAGIMGGAATAVSHNTTDIFLESAFFSPAAMAGRARRFGLHTDASLRFERGVDFTHQVRAIERATELLLQIVGGKAGPVADVRAAGKLPIAEPVKLRRSRLAKILGVAIADDDVSEMLASLGCGVRNEADGWLVSAPGYRFDIAIEEDLVEEIVRLYGYDKVPEQPQLSRARLSLVTESAVSLKRARDLLVDHGYQEVINYSFVDPQKQTELLGDAVDLELANPLSREQSVMRRSLWTGLLQAAVFNQKRQQNRVRLFEAGVIFNQGAGQVFESESIAGLAWGAVLPEQWGSKSVGTDVFDIKSDLEALLELTGQSVSIRFVAAEHPTLRPGRTVRIDRGDIALGWLGELHPRLAKKWNMQPAPVLFELNVKQAFSALLPTFAGVSKFPSVRRDLAVLVGEDTPAEDLVIAARDAAGDLLRDIRVFDIYTGKGIENSLKSVALGLILQETSRTLTELEIDGVIDAVAERLSSEFNATIRE